MEMRNETKSESLVQRTDTCCHHWMIQSAVGPVSEGSCQNCGEVRAFKNSIDYEAEWTNRRDEARSKVPGPDGAPQQSKEIAG